jgi:hypothetical protein
MHVAVYNWDRLDTVRVDLSGHGVPTGALVSVRAAQDPYGEPLRLAYDGGALALPMTGWNAASPIGWSGSKSLPPAFPEFGVFLLSWDRPNLAGY